MPVPIRLNDQQQVSGQCRYREQEHDRQRPSLHADGLHHGDSNRRHHWPMANRDWCPIGALMIESRIKSGPYAGMTTTEAWDYLERSMAQAAAIADNDVCQGWQCGIGIRVDVPDPEPDERLCGHCYDKWCYQLRMKAQGLRS